VNLNGSPTTPPSPARDIQCAVLNGGDVAVVRVSGRGTFQNSVPLRQLADHLRERGKPRDFIVDLSDCSTMDSTFLGGLAAVSIAQKRGGRSPVVVVNANSQVRRLFKKLGLMQVLEVADDTADTKQVAESCRDEMAPAPVSGTVSYKDQIAHTLEAHKILCDIEAENTERFQTVIEYLEKSLQEESDKH
jgi:anti-anti-sigma factor